MKRMKGHRTVALAFTGASGLPYGLRLLECLIAASARVYLVYSPASQIVARQELDLTFPTQPAAAAAFFAQRYSAKPDQLTVFGREDWFSPVASGSNPADAMAICPCSMGTLGAIASGLADNLLERAADVMLKERRPLVLVPRETPLSTIRPRPGSTDIRKASKTLSTLSSRASSTSLALIMRSARAGALGESRRRRSSAPD